MMLSVFGDESTDEMQQRVFALGGIMATEFTWKELETAWVERTGGIPFHAVDCDSDLGNYKDNSHLQNKTLYKDLTILLSKSAVRGYARAYDLIASDKHFPDSPREMTYYTNFVHVLCKMGEWAKSLNSTVDFTFDSRKESNGNAGFLYSIFANLPEWDKIMLPKVSFVSSVIYTRVQAADLFIREAMKELDRELAPKKRERRKSLCTLEETNHFGVDIYSEEYFRDYRNKFDALENTAGMARTEYAAWLVKYGPADTPRNRIRFFAWKEQQDAKK